MTRDLLPKAIKLLFLPNVLDCPYKLGCAHLLVDKIVFVWPQTGFAFLQSLFELVYWEWQRLAKLLH